MAQGRVQRVAGEIKKEISRIIQEELKDPRIGFATITNVEVTRDLRQAKVYFSVFGTKKQSKDTQIGLNRSAGFIRKLLWQRMHLRYVPELIFKADENIEYSVHISEIIDKIENERKANERRESH